MSSLWHVPREDSPSVLSDRVYSIRRLNKMESQRLGSQLNILNAQIAHSKSMISQEQTALRKELAQIREIKDNPSIGLERRKRLQQMSSKESQTCRHHSSVEPQVTQSRFRSQSTGHPPVQSCQLSLQSRFRSLSTGHPPMDSSQLLSLMNGRQKNSATCPPLRLGVDKLSGAFRGWKKSGTLHDINNNTPAQEVRTDVIRNQKIRSLSTGTPPQIPAWVKDTNDGVAANTTIDDSEVSIFTKVQSWQKTGNWCQDRVKLEFGHSPNWAWKKKIRDISDQNSVTDASSKVKMNGTLRLIPPDFRPRQGVISHAPSKLVSKRRERRCYSTNSTPIISEGRVVGLCDKTTTVLQPIDTSCTPKGIDEETFGAPNDNAVRKREVQSIPVPSNRRQRSLSSSQRPPVILERRRTMETHSNNGGQDLTRDSFEDEQEKTLSRDTEETNLSNEQVESDEDFNESQNSHNNNDSYDLISQVVLGRNGMGHENEIS